MTKEEEFLALVTVAVPPRKRTHRSLDAAKRTARRIPEYVIAWDAAGVFVRWLFGNSQQGDASLLRVLRPEEE
jgi:hypothetical protein